jgi:uncharacterized membrane protein YhhN
MSAAVLWVVVAVLAVVDWVAVARHDRTTERVAKPAALVALVLVALASGATDSGAGRWLTVALLFSLVGDVALLGDTMRRFLLGVGAFLLGHLAYVASFVALGLAAPAWAWIAVPVLGAATYATRRVVPSAYAQSGAVLAGAVAAYTAVLAGMLVGACLTGEPLVAAGATLFVVSDGALAVVRFDRPRNGSHLVVMVTYHAAQALLTIGVLIATGAVT